MNFSPQTSRTAYVVPATWIDEAIILNDDELTRSWKAKTVGPNLLFAGRLTEEKGIRVFLDAVQKVDARSPGLIFGRWRWSLEAAMCRGR